MDKKNYGVARKIEQQDIDIVFEAEPQVDESITVDVYCKECDAMLKVKIPPQMDETEDDYNFLIVTGAIFVIALILRIFIFNTTGQFLTIISLWVAIISGLAFITNFNQTSPEVYIIDSPEDSMHGTYYS